MKFNKILVGFLFFFLLLINVQAEDGEHPYLKELFVDGKAIENFDPEVYEYELTFPTEKDSIKLSYTAGDGFKVKNTGNLTLDYGLNVFVITVSNTDDDINVDYTLRVIREDNRNSDNYLSSLIVGGKQVDLEKDKDDYEVSVDNGIEKVSISAVPESLNAQFVEGYGPREGVNAVTLSGAKTNVEVKVEAENGEIRTYSISIVKPNYQSNDATLKSLKITEIPFNFLSNIAGYKLEVNNDIEEINIEAVPNHERATVEYDKKETLKEGLNTITIRVTAEDGTLKEYKLEVTRKEAENLVDNIKIDGLRFDFNPSVYSYEIRTGAKSLDFKVSLTKESATSKILNNTNLQDGSIVKIQVSDAMKDVTYEFKIIKPDAAKVYLAADINANRNFFKKYEMIIALGSLGVGVLGTLMALITRPKKKNTSDDSQIM